MSFVKQEANRNRIEDTVFQVVKMAKQAKAEWGEDMVVDATIGSLYDEQGRLVAYHSVFDTFNAIDNRIKASYSGSFTGNENYRRQVEQWLFHDIDLHLKRSVLATPGGTGAVNMVMTCCLSKGDTILLPEVAWGSYKLMAQEYGLQIETYSLFDGEHFNVQDFRTKAQTIMARQQKLLVVINDPCHNPTGYSLTIDEWNAVIDILNTCSKQGHVVLLNDVAYLDYSYDLKHVHRYMECFNRIEPTVAVIIAFSCSKTCTSYGLRIGAAVILAKTQEAVDELEIVMEKMARATWSNINNSGMENFVRVTTDHKTEFEAEKAEYIGLLKQRSDILVQEAKACGLPIYPYKEGFFVTLRIEDNDRCRRYHQALIDQNIYTVRVNKGIRVAVCSISVKKAKGLAKRMKDILDSIA